MVVKAIKTYKDKYTGGTIPAGVLLDMEQERAEELNAAPGGPYVEDFYMGVLETFNDVNEPEKDEAQQEEQEITLNLGEI